MTEKELKRLGRRELIEIIATMKKTELELRGRLKKADQQLADRTIRQLSAGSIAEAALSLNQVFEAAQASADAYLHSLYASCSDTAELMTHAQDERDRMLRAAREEADARLLAADKECARRLAAADGEIAEKWAVFQENVQNVLKANPQLQVSPSPENE